MCAVDAGRPGIVETLRYIKPTVSCVRFESLDWARGVTAAAAALEAAPERGGGSSPSVLTMKYTVVNWLEPMIDFFWENRKKLKARADAGETIDYPEYFGLPKKISGQFSSNHVDLLQEHLSTAFSCGTKNSFSKYIVELLTNDTVNVVNVK